MMDHLGREERTAWRPVLLSALVCPGLGQLARRQYIKGLALAALSVLVAAGLAFEVARELLRSLALASGELDLLQVVVAVQRVREASGGVVLLGTLVLAALWIYAVVDAYHHS